MPPSRYEPLFPISVLRLFRDRIGVGSAWTAEEILHALRDSDGWLEYGYYRRIIGADVFYTPQQLLTAVLQSLADMGLVALDDSLEESSGFQRWRIGHSWRPPEPPSGGDGGGDGGGGNVDSTADGGDDDDGGGGLREALGHPVLLALSQDDFDELVNGLFVEVQP